MFASRSALQGALFAAAAAALLAQAALARTSAHLERLREPLQVAEIAASVPDADALRLLALGHREALADLVWLQALSFVGQHFGLRRDPDWLEPHLDAITTLDPRFALVYTWAGTAIMYSGTIDNPAVMASNRILERGIDRFPYAWDLHFMRGVNYLFELRTDDPELQAEWRRKGAESIARASTLPDAPPFLVAASASLFARRAALADLTHAAARGLLWSEDRAQQFSLQAQLRLRAPADTAAATLRQRDLLRPLAQSPRMSVDPGALSLVLHPDPALHRPAALPTGPETSP